jgi:hypothetical protein
MVLEKIMKEVENYKHLIVLPEYDEIYKWEALKNFQDNWNIEAEDFKTIYDNSFYSKVTGNLWANPHWFPKAVMLQFIEKDKERVRQMFRDLFNEDENIDKRIERFVFNCDQLRDEVYGKDNGKNHFHDGQRMVSLYLAFRFPEKYAIYKYTEFKKFMEVVKAKNVPTTGEYERFFKVVRTIYAILKNDNELISLHQSLLEDDCYEGETLMLAQDFIFIIARRYLNP